MAGLPKAADPALAALSTQLPTENLAGAEEEEHLAVDGGRASLDRRTSGAASFRSEYTSATGGNSVYESAAEGSRTTLNTLQPSESERSFPEAQSGLGARDPSNQDLTMHALAQEPSTPVVSDSQHEGTDASTARASAEPTPTGTLASHPSTIRPTVIPRPSPATSDTKKSDDEKRDTSSAEKNDELDLENEAADETIVKEMAGLPEDYRKVLQAQIHMDKKPPVKFFQLFRFATKFELMLNGLGILAAIVAGATQPLMTVIFGALTSAFTNFSLAQYNVMQNPGPDSSAALQRSIDALFVEVNKDVLYLVYVGIATFVATFIYQGAWIYTGEANTRRVREAYLRAVLRQNIAYTDVLGAGEVTTRIETDTHLIQEGVSDKISMSVMFISTFVTGFVVAFIRNWRLALVVSTIVPCIAIAGAMMNKFISAYKQQMLEETARGATLAEEVISSVRNTHAFGTQKRLTAMYDGPNLKTLEIGLKSAFANGMGLGTFFFIIYSSYALAFYYGTTLILQGRATSGQIVNVFFSILIGAFSLAQLAPLLQSVSFALASASSIFSTIDRVPVIDSASEEGLKPKSVEGVIEVKNLDFIYPSRPAVQVLYQFEAVFPQGKTTALVGGSGSGKSTIIGLIERFYDPVAGSITLDGTEVKDLNVRWLRTQIGLVSQEPTLFATTVAGNIEHGLIGTLFENESAEEKRKRVIEAAVQANADGFISALPQGYDTMIGERGMLLSGGQKQRIAIARAIIGDPAILLLDEATSALDTASEGIVQNALDRAAKGRTTITIAHRLSTIKDADQIIVLTAGRILEKASTSEEGSAHDILLKNPEGAYSKLVGAQRFKEKEDADSDSDEEETPAARGPLTDAQIAEQAANEKPQFENLKRTGTGRSAASEALEQKHQHDLEAAEGTPRRSFVYLIRRLLQINRSQWLDYVLAVAASILAGCVYPVFGIVFGGAIQVFSYDPVTRRDELRSGGDRNALYCFIIAIIATVGIVVQNFYFGRSVEHLSRTLRLRTFSSILRQDIAFFDRDENSTGHLVSVIADWAQKISGLFGVTAGVILQSIFTIIVGAVIGLSYAWKVSLVGIACIPLTVAAGIVRLKVVVTKDVKNKLSHQQSAQMACEAAGAIRTVASLTREEDVNRIYSEYLDKPQQQSNRTAVWSNALYALSQSLSLFVIALIFWYGAHQIVDGALTTRTFFIAMISIVFGSIQAGNVFSFVPDMSKARGAADDVIKLMDSTPEIDAEDPSGKIMDTAKCSGHIKFSNVHFRYPTRPHVRVLRGLDLEVLPGQFVAIVGPSGCGKSTLIQLVERFYDPLSGSVLVDGQDISELNVQSYRRSVSLVSQEPTLYAGSVRFNITLGATTSAEAVTQAEVEQACKDANIHDFVMSLPDGYDTEVGGKGTQLSGGQKQRIAIARALIRNPKILLLDEATSALDSESERVVQAALDQAAKGRSTIAVAHRLSTIQAADVICVLRDGKVAEKGKHFELLAKKGIYSELVLQQDLGEH